MEKKKIRFNIIDAIIILAVVLLGAFVLMKLTNIGSGMLETPDTKTYHITFYEKEVPTYVVENTHIGDSAYDDTDAVNLGKVIDIQHTPYISVEYVDGKEVGLTSIDNNTAYITVEVQGSPNEHGVLVDGMLYGVGHTFVFRAGIAKYYLSVFSIEEVD